MGFARRDAFQRAREMRRRLTPTEAGLWAQLKTWRADGFHFRRQAPFRGYWLDFVCFSHRLVVEVDGMHHETDPEQAAHDALRDRVLAREGFVTRRYSTFQVGDHMGWVLGDIRDTLRMRPPPSPTLRVGCPPQEGRD